MYTYHSGAADVLRNTMRIAYMKQYFLKLDIQSRKFVINACIEFIDSVPHEDDQETNALKNWFLQFSIITEDGDTAMRKGETKSHLTWDTLFDLKNNLCLHVLGMVIYSTMK